MAMHINNHPVVLRFGQKHLPNHVMPRELWPPTIADSQRLFNLGLRWPSSLPVVNLPKRDSGWFHWLVPLLWLKVCANQWNQLLVTWPNTSTQGTRITCVTAVWIYGVVKSQTDWDVQTRQGYRGAKRFIFIAYWVCAIGEYFPWYTGLETIFWVGRFRPWPFSTGLIGNMGT